MRQMERGQRGSYTGKQLVRQILVQTQPADMIDGQQTGTRTGWNKKWEKEERGEGGTEGGGVLLSDASETMQRKQFQKEMKLEGMHRIFKTSSTEL